ncbi:ribonucleoside reductase class II [Candidatus Collierbacteria bacterium]|nr:ribonucleoside reductase class II [Candidatus Collierbacteria bacterium]
MTIIEPKLSPTAVKIAQKRYLRTDMDGKIIETPGEMFYRVAHHMAKAEIQWSGNGIVKEITEQFYERMVNFKFVCGGKAMFEAGNPGGTGQLSSCFVLPVEDDIDSIFKTLGQAAVVHKNNGGTGFNFSHIRPHGDKVRNVPGASSGPVDFLAAYSAALSKILQGSKRRGANIGILNADHPDIEDFIRLKDEDGTVKNFNVSVGVTDDFMTAVKNDKMWNLINPRTKEVVRRIKAKKLFRTIVEHSYATGDPGLMFLDTFNRDNPTPQIGRIESTNPCITGDALISTEKGLMRFDELHQKHHKSGRIGLITDHRVITGTGAHLYHSDAFYDQGKKEVFELVTKSGLRLKATADHKILTMHGWKALKELVKGDLVMIQSGAGQFRKKDAVWNQKLGQLVGYIIGDGFVRNDPRHGGYICVTFGLKRRRIAQYIKSILEEYVTKVVTRQPNPRTIQIWKHSKKYAQWFIDELGISQQRSSGKVVPLPVFGAPLSAVIGFLQGLFSADGTIGFVPGKSAYIRLTSKSQQLLFDVQRLLLNLGIISRVYDRSRRPRSGLFPKYINKKGEIKRYGSDGKLWELEISKDATIKFLDKIGFLTDLHQEKISLLRAKEYYHAQPVNEVAYVRPAGKERVYDLTEPITHSFIANGIVVSNCGEIGLLPYESCNLTSICLQNHLRETGSLPRGKAGKKQETMIDWEDLEKSIRLGVRFLDDMIEVNTYALPEIEQMVKNGNRRIGLGVMGFSHMLVLLGIPYNSDQAVELSEKLAKFIRTNAEDESSKLAKERGSFQNWDRSIYFGNKSMRNCATTMIAPTGTISMLADTTSGIEPIFSLVTKRKTFFEDDKRNKPTKELYMVDQMFEEELTFWLKKQTDSQIASLLSCYLDENKKVQSGSKITRYQDNKITIKKLIIEQIAEYGLTSVKGLPDWFYDVFVTTHQIAPDWHVKIQAAWQKYFDNSISKTINFPHDATPDDVEKAYLLAWKLGCKGITIYRDGSKKDQVLNLATENRKQKTENNEEEIHPSSRRAEPLGGAIIHHPLRPGSGQAAVCPECGAAVIAENGCVTCHSCGWSKCAI